MTDKFIILKPVTEGVTEGFFKTDGKKLLVAFKGENGEYLWVTDNRCEEFNGKNHWRGEGEIQGSDLGIFKKQDSGAVLMLFNGSAENVKSNFRRLTGLETVSYEQEKHVEKQEEPAYKETDYELPKEFLQPSGETPETYWECNEKRFLEEFENNPENQLLGALIPGSKWVSCPEYVLGIIYDEDNQPMYICYGFSLPWSEEPPEKLEGYCQWIPTDCARPKEEGFWVIYINAKTGERVK